MQRQQPAVNTRPLGPAVRAETVISLGDNALEAIRAEAVAKSPALAPTVLKARIRASALVHPGGQSIILGLHPLRVGSDSALLHRARRGPVREEIKAKAARMDPKALTALARAARTGIGAQVRRDIGQMYAYDCGVVILRRCGMETFRRSGPSPSPRALFAVGALSGTPRMTTALFPDRTPVKDPQTAACPIHGAAAYRRLAGDALHKDQTDLRDRL